MINEVQIGEVAEVNPKIPETLLRKHSEVVSFVPMAGVSEDGVLAFSEEKNLMDVRKGYTYFERGDLLIAKITPCFENGKAVLVNNLPHPVGFGSTEFHVLRPSTDIDPKYLFYFIHSPAFRFIGQRNMTGTAGQKRLPVDFLKSYKIPLPSVLEQKRTAAILDKADAIRHKRRRALQLADDFLRATFLDIFGDPVTNPKGWKTGLLGDYTDMETGLAFKSKHYKSAGVRLCRGANVLPKTIDWYDVMFWDESDKSVPPKYHLRAGDIVLAMDRPWISSGLKAARISKDDLPSYLVQRVARLRGINGTTDDYIYHLILHPAFTHHCNPKKTETTVLHISPHDIRSYKIPLPPSKKIEEFSMVLKKHAEIMKCQQKHFEIDTIFFNSLIQRAFRGEL